MTNKELGKAIRDALKAAGIPARAVSVRVRDAGLSTAVDVNIKDLKIDRKQVEEIAYRFRHVRYDEYNGEVLQGCNTFVHVQFDYDTLEAETEKYLADAQEVIDNFTSPHVGAEIMRNERAGTTLVYFYEAPGSKDNMVRVRNDGDQYCRLDNGRYSAYNAEILARAMAIFDGQGRFK